MTPSLKFANRETSLSQQLFRIGFSLLITAVLFFSLRWSVNFMRDVEAPEQLLLTVYTRLGMDEAAATLEAEGLNPLSGKLMITFVALAVGVAGVWLIFWVGNELVARLPDTLREWVLPFVFVGPAILILTTYLIYPTFNTIYLSLTEDVFNVPEEVPEELRGAENIAESLVTGAKNVTFASYLVNTDSLEIAKIIVLSKNDETPDRSFWLVVRGDEIKTWGFQNYLFAFTSPEMGVAFRNNVLWLVIGTGGSVGIGLLVATLVDRIKREALAKSFIFLPLAISFVGASVIWKFVYAWQPPGRPQIGILNALVTQFGLEPIPWLVETSFNTYALIIIMIWLQTGFAMVVLSAALKGVPGEVIEAARIDGANEIQLFFRIIIPMIRGSIITVGTTVFIAILKVFDIVYVMTNGKFDTEVVANRMFVEMFTFRNFGRASSLAVILLAVVIPIMVVNIRNLRQQGINQ